METPTQRLVLVHAALAGLAPLVPLPLVDDLAHEFALRRMVRVLASRHGCALDDDQVATLADPPGGSVIAEAAKSVVLFPLKLLLKKTFVVLAAKKMTDQASAAYVRGHLLDHALASGWCAPRGKHPPRALRRALDAVCRELNPSPVEQALGAGFTASKRLFDDARRAFLDRFGSAADRVRVRDVEASVDAIADAAKNDRAPGGVADDGAAGTGGGGPIGRIVVELRAALGAVPRSWFEDAERRLARELGEQA